MTAQQLKNAILQEAIQGRLVPQDPNDEPASALLERIRKEKERLVKEGKLKKKELEEKPISEDEIPFEIPESWEWVRMSSLCSLITKGTTPRGGNVAYADKGIGFLRAENVSGIDRINTRNLKFIDKATNDGYLRRSILQENDLLITIAGTLGRTAIVRYEDLPLNANQAISLCRFIDVNKISLLFIVYALNAPDIQKMMLSYKKITAIPNLTLEIISDTIIPLPPLAEQKRIVEKVEELMPKVEEYGKAQDALNKLNEELPEKLKKSILQEAIEGRLVPQDPNDEPASVLLQKIRKEKQQLVKEGKLKKKDLEETPISEDEIPFEIPENWEWCRVGTVAEYINGLAFKPEDWETSGIPIIRIQNLTDYSKPLNYTTKTFDNKFKVENGDLLFSWSATLDSFIWKGKTAWLNQHIFKVNPRVGILKEYLYYALKAIVSNLSDITHGLTMKHLTRGVFENYSFPLPPLAEQKRIVAKIEQLSGEINKLNA